MHLNIRENYDLMVRKHTIHDSLIFFNLKSLIPLNMGLVWDLVNKKVQASLGRLTKGGLVYGLVWIEIY